MGKHEFFDRMAQDFLGLTSDDVLLIPQRSDVVPATVSLKSYFSRRVPLNIPIVSAAMDTVTGRRMAIALAKQGGLGIIHRGFSPDDQALEVARVKFHMNGCIRKPITVRDTNTIKQILAHRDDKGYGFHTFPVLDASDKLVGVLTHNDFDLCDNHELLARNVMSTGLVTAPENTSLARAHRMMQEHGKKVLPLVKDDGTLAGMYVFSDVQRITSSNTSICNVDEHGQLRVGIAVGVDNDAFQRLELCLPHGLDVAVIDTAHAHSGPVLRTLRAIKADSRYNGIDIVAGNISQTDAALELIEAGADGVKVGQGPGSICTTRIVTGAGFPQLTAVYQCAVAALEKNIPVCADGGIRFSGDVAKALAAGASSVMLGSMLAGTTESPGEIITLNGREYKAVRGMGSLGAMIALKSSLDRYRQDDKKFVPEGIEGMVPHSGLLSKMIDQLCGGISSGMGYVGAESIQALWERGTFIRVTPAGVTESHPHNVIITREAPNYPSGGES